MKFRFFLILLLSLSAVGIALSISFNYYLNNARLELIDLQLRASAVALVNSEFADIKKIKFREAERLISEELGSSSIGKLFIIRNKNGEIAFRSGSASLMDINPPNSPQLYSYNVKGQTVRILNLNLPTKSDRTLQIGTILDPNILEWNSISKELPIYLAITIIPILLFSFILTNYLLNPLKLMANHLQLATNDLQNLRPVPDFPKKLIRYTKKSRFNNDEFTTLVENTHNLLERININYKMTKPWTYQLAHEIKTPLSILRFEVESLADEKLKDHSIINSMNEQIHRISNTVSQFLEWASVENTQQKDNLFALRIVSSVEAQVNNLERIYPGRINYLLKEDFTVISNPQHLQQLISNLLTNALNYSPGNSSVTIESFDNTLKIADLGKGVPKEVLERIGQPFNCGPKNPLHKHNRTGLGLAWINTLTRLYNWNLNIQSGNLGTVIAIKFIKI
ncbi:MAG: HAMP domain-containing sensor histidine kinase [Bacteriovorax sp.]|nr:HAMP domain-containing sensor histidine kinase [Bacteriovorax sp.]